MAHVFDPADWKAPNLDCAVLKVIEYRRDNTGNVTGHFEIQAVKIKAGTPDPKLFEIPIEYAEKSPSLLYEAYIGNSGIPDRPMSPSMRRRLEREDQKYFENHRAEGQVTPMKNRIKPHLSQGFGGGKYH